MLPVLQSSLENPKLLNPDLECFDALPVSTFEAIGSSAGAIRKIKDRRN